MSKSISEMERETRYRFRTKDHPEANGRKPQAGETQWKLYFPLDEGGYLCVQVGEKAMRNFRDVLDQERNDDARGKGG